MDYYLGQIIMGGWNFAPRGTAFCNGQLLPIAEYSALYSLLGTTYGGDGRTTFALPDLRGRAPIHFGQGPGLSSRPLGSKGGTEETTQVPSHNHGLSQVTVRVPVSEEDADQDEVAGHYLANGQFYHANADSLYGKGPIPVSGSTDSAGSGSAVNNMQPFGTINYVMVTVQGIFPSRS